jgi:hypothetical protein
MTLGESVELRERVRAFLIENNISYVQYYMGGLKQRDLDGDHLWIRNGVDCLTIGRNAKSEPAVMNQEGEWHPKEVEMAKYLYQFTEAAKR